MQFQSIRHVSFGKACCLNVDMDLGSAIRHTSTVSFSTTSPFSQRLLQASDEKSCLFQEPTHRIHKISPTTRPYHSVGILFASLPWIL